MVEISGEMKKEKYATLQKEMKANGWKVQLYGFGVGCRGFKPSSIAQFLKKKKEGITGT